MTATPESVALAREMLGSTEGEYPDDLYAFPVQEVRTLARAVVATANLADRLDAEASAFHASGLYASMIRAVLNGGSHE